MHSVYTHKHILKHCESLSRLTWKHCMLSIRLFFFIVGSSLSCHNIAKQHGSNTNICYNRLLHIIFCSLSFSSSVTFTVYLCLWFSRLFFVLHFSNTQNMRLKSDNWLEKLTVYLWIVRWRLSYCHREWSVFVHRMHLVYVLCANSKRSYEAL